MIRRRFPLRHNLYARAITFLCGSAPEINRVLRRECPKGEEHRDLSPDCIGRWVLYVEDGYEADYLCIVTRRDKNEMLAALAHECLHHVNYALRKAGMPLANESDEAYCYYFQWVFRNCLDAMK